MKTVTWHRLIIFTLAAALAFGATITSTSAAGKTYRLKIQSAFPHGDISTDNLKAFAEAAAKYSDGQLEIKTFADPEIVPSDQLLTSTKQGVLDMLQGAPIQWGGIIPVSQVEFGLPMAFNIPEKETFEDKAAAIREFFFEQGLADLLREEYAKLGLYWLDIHTYGPVPVFLATEPATKCEDLNGRKIRSEGINLAWHSSIGMSSAAISGVETYMALKLGTVDAAEWDISAITGLKWHEVAPNWIRGMENDHAIGHILVSLKKWEKFPEEIKAALHKAAEDYWHTTVNAYKTEVQTALDLAKEGKLKENMLDEACRAQYRESAMKLWEDIAKEDAVTAKAVEMVRQWRNNN